MATKTLTYLYTGKDVNLSSTAHKAHKSIAGAFSGISKTSGVVTTAVAAIGTVGLGKVIAAGEEATRITHQTEAVLKSTGNVAHVSAGQVQQLADAMMAKTGIDDEAIRTSENLILTFRDIRNESGKNNDIYNQTVKATLDMTSALYHGDVSAENLKNTSIQLGKALNDPLTGLTALRRSGVQFTAQQVEQIKTLVQSGHTLEAQKIILGEVTKEFGGSAEANATATGKMKTAFGEVIEQIGLKLLPSVKQLSDWLLIKGIPAISKFIDKMTPITSGILSTAATGIKALADGFHKLPGPVQIAVGAIAGISVALYALDAHPIVVVAAAIVLLVGALVKYQPQITGFFKRIAAGMGDLAIQVIQGSKVMTDAFLRFVGSMIHGADKALGWIPGLGPLLHKASAAFDNWSAGVDQSFDNAINATQNWQDRMRGAVDVHQRLTDIMLGQLKDQQKASSVATMTLDKYTDAISKNGVGSDVTKKSRDKLIKDLTDAGVDAATARRDVSNYTAAVRDNGANSDQAKAARQRLNQDLNTAGNNARSATGKMQDLSRSINNLPRQTQINIREVISGGGKIVIQGDVAVNRSTGIGVSLQTGEKTFNGYAYASGGRLPGFGGGDRIPVLAEAGETIVDKDKTRRFASLFAAMGVPGFARGGVVGMNNSIISETTKLSESVMGRASLDFATKARNYFQRLFNSIFSGMTGGAYSASARVAQQFAASQLAGWGWGMNQLAPLISLWNGESGWNAYAVNKSSGAYGIPQALGHGHPFNLGDYQAQIRWGLAYIFSTYGSPANAYRFWLSQSPHWYDSGGILPPGLTLAMNGTGRDEYISRDRQGNTYNITVPVTVQGHTLASKQEIGRVVSDALRDFQKKGGNVPFR